MKKIQLSIPEPCHENWDSMAPTEQGRYCNACAKEVIDFSNMSDSDVLNYFLKKKENEKVCGRAYPDQLERDIYALPQKKRYWQWQYILSAILFFMKPAKSSAQIKGMTVPVAVDTARKKCTMPDERKGEIKSIIKGIVKDEMNRPVAGASVVIKGTRRGAVSDANGMFSLQVGNGNEMIVVSSVGYKTKEIVISNFSANEIVLQLAPFTLGGDVVVTRTCSVRVGGMRVKGVRVKSRKNNFKNAFVDLFAPPPLKIYPNPIQRGSAFTISLKLKQTGVYAIQIVDVSGRIVAEKKINALSKEWNEKIESSSNWAAGTYYVKVMDEKGRLFKSAGIAVQ